MKDLLEKYIKYVFQVEGSDYIQPFKETFSDVEFTEEEWQILKEISIKVNGK